MNTDSKGPHSIEAGRCRRQEEVRAHHRMTMSPVPFPAFEFLPHVGEARLRLHGRSIEEILRQAMLALAELLWPDDSEAGPGETQEIHLEAPDRAILLIDWLNALLYLAERDCWIPQEVQVHAADETHVSATVRGCRPAEAPSRVKAATWHGLRFDRQDGGYEAEVLLDL